MEFGRLLKMFIVKAGLSQKSFADKINLSPTALSLIVSGKVKPRQVTLTKIMEFLNLPDEDEQKLLKTFENYSSLPEDKSAPSNPLEIYQENRERCFRYLEIKSRSIAFENEVEHIFRKRKINYTKDYFNEGIICDFYIPETNEAFECKFNIMRDPEKTLTMARIIKENMKLDKISIIVPMRSEIPVEILNYFADFDIDIISLPELVGYAFMPQIKQRKNIYPKF